MIEPSLEEMMRYMIEGKRQLLCISLVVISLIFGIICLILFILKKYFIPESHKVFIRITLILFSIVYLFFIGNRLYGYKFAKNQSPFGGGIYIAYYECLKCESLHGGIYGKGPTESMILDKECVHKWNAIEKKTFDKAYEFKTEKE